MRRRTLIQAAGAAATSLALPALRALIHQRFDLSLGTGLGKVKGRMFRIGHLGDCNDLTLMAALSGCEMGLKLAGSGVAAIMDHFAEHKH